MKRYNLFFYLATAFICTMMSGCTSSNNIDDKIELLPVQMEEDGKWSFVDSEGKIKYEDEFKNAPSCVVNGVFSVSEKDGYTLYKADSKPTPIKDCEGLKAAGYLSEGLIPIVRDKSRITLIDDSGKDQFTLEPVKGKEIVSCAGGYSDGMLKVEVEGGEIGFVNTKGEVIVKPVYEAASDFSDGRAVVKKDDNYSIIDKKGDVILKLKNDWVPVGGFSYGVVVVKDANDHILFVDEKGEGEKCPSKVKNVSGYNAKYYIFSDGESSGVMSRKDNEVIVRAKYNQIIFGEDNSFICIDDKGTYILNSKGDIQKTLDEFEGVYSLGKFGLFAKDKKTWLMLDSKGEAKKGCEFHDIFPLRFFGFSIESDYFSLEGMANDVIENVNPNGFGDIKLGVTPQSLLSDAEKYTYTSKAEIESLSGKGFKYDYTVSAGFSGYIASSVYDYDYYSYGASNYYVWNNVLLSNIEILINAETSLGGDAVKAFVSALEKKGFKLYASNYNGGGGAVLLNSNESTILIESQNGSSQLSMAIGKLLGSEQMKEIKEAIDSYDGSNKAEPVFDEVEDDTIEELTIDTTVSDW